MNGHTHGVSHTNGSGHSPAPVSAATKLRKIIENPDSDIIVGPGVYDGFSARIALGVGFNFLYMVCQQQCRTR
jgi:2-methylisocitrate lyase-like PEP mutase family enzyme